MSNLTNTEALKTKLNKISDLADKVFPAEIQEKLISYSSVLLEWNQKINLISRKDEEQFFENHLAPSLSYYLFDFINSEDKNIIDIGSGGGLPGIVNAICFPEKKFTLVDSTKKKISVLEDIIQKLALKNVNTIWSRIEEINIKKGHAKQYDVCTSRGLAAIKTLITLSIPFLNGNGVILALKGGDLSEEIKEIKKPSRFEITEYEMDERFFYLDRFQTLKMVEIGKSNPN
jgi:16S rRNA (guanine527-N7)-methyltransferase